MSSNLKKICLSIGYPIKFSLSPIMHNAGFKKLGIDSEFIYLAAEVTPENLENAVKGIKGLDIRGVSVTMPHKEEVMKYLDEINEDAKKIGAVNTIFNQGGKLIGYNTDWIGAVKALKQKTSLRGKRVAVLGAGGAARAIVYGLMEEEVIVKIYNRTPEKAKELAILFCCEFAVMDKIGELYEADIIVNASSVGMGKEQSLVPIEFLRKGQIVFKLLDIVFLS